MNTNDLLAIQKKLINGFGTKSDIILSVLSGKGTVTNGLDLNDNQADSITFVKIFVAKIAIFELEIQHTEKPIDTNALLKDKSFWRNAVLYKGGNSELFDLILKPTDESRDTYGIHYVHLTAIPFGLSVLSYNNKGVIL